MVTIQISKIRILYKGKFIKIRQHPYYKSLKTQSGQKYEYCISKSEHAQKVKNTSTWKGMKKLVNIIENKGFKPYLSPFKIEYNSRIGHYVVEHGRHRMCIIRYLYGNKLKIRIDENNFILELIK